MKREIVRRATVALLCILALSVAVMGMMTLRSSPGAEATPPPSPIFTLPPISSNISLPAPTTEAQKNSGSPVAKSTTTTETSATTTEAPTTTEATTTTEGLTTTTTAAAGGGGLSGGGTAGIVVAALVVLGVGGGLTYWRFNGGKTAMPPEPLDKTAMPPDPLENTAMPPDPLENTAMPPEPLDKAGPTGASPLQEDYYEYQRRNQEQQMFMQILSSVMKSGHDLVKAIIRNLR